MKLKVLVWCILVVLVLWPVAGAQAATSLEFRYWGFQQYLGSYTTPRYVGELQIDRGRWGARLWGGVGGLAGDGCVTEGLCYDLGFWAADVTYRLNPWLRAFAGRYSLYGSHAGEEYAYRLNGTGGNGFMDHRHEGWRAGLMANVRLRPRLSLVGEWAYLWDTYSETSPWAYVQNGTGTWGGAGSGQSYKAALQYALSPSTYVTAGYESWRFHLPGGPYGPWGYYGDHVWEGIFVGLGVRK